MSLDESVVREKCPFNVGNACIERKKPLLRSDGECDIECENEPCSFASLVSLFWEKNGDANRQLKGFRDETFKALCRIDHNTAETERSALAIVYLLGELRDSLTRIEKAITDGFSSVCESLEGINQTVDEGLADVEQAVQDSSGDLGEGLDSVNDAIDEFEPVSVASSDVDLTSVVEAIHDLKGSVDGMWNMLNNCLVNSYICVDQI